MACWRYNAYFDLSIIIIQDSCYFIQNLKFIWETNSNWTWHSYYFQAFINIGVSLQVLPVTGQNLPMISSGGTSAWMTCIAMGIILSVSAKNEVRYEENLNENNPLNVLSETI